MQLYLNLCNASFMKREFNDIKYLSSLCVEVSKIGESYLSQFNIQNLTKLNQISSILFIERLSSNLLSTSFLIAKITSNPGIENSIGLILRSNLNDCRSIFNLFAFIEDKENEQKALKTIFGESLKKTINILRKKGYSEKDFSQSIQIIKNRYKSIILLSELDIDNIGNETFCNLKLENVPSNLENLYLVYSKYEHFGINTLILQRDNDLREILNRIEIAIHYSIQGIIISLSYLNIQDNSLNKKNIELSKRSK